MTPFSAQSMILSTSTGNSQRKLVTTYLVQLIPSLKNSLENSPDIVWIEEEKALGIEQIRNLKLWVQEKPYAQDWKVAVVLHADTLTGEAQNAALKLLEEPPSYAHILLVTAKPFALQATVRSRCSFIALHETTQKHIAHDLPTNIVDAFALTDTLAKDRGEATRWFEHALLQHHAKLETHPFAETISAVTLLQSGLHNLKRNVNVRLAVEDVFLQNLYKNS